MKKITEFMLKVMFSVGLLALTLTGCMDNSINSPLDDPEVEWVFDADDTEGDTEAPVSRGLKKGPASGMAERLQVTLLLNEVPSGNNFTRYISFQNGAGQWKRIPIAFKKVATKKYFGKVDADNNPNALALLNTMNDVGNRWYWDRIFLENRNGSTSLNIRSIHIYVKYPDKHNDKTNIPLASGILNKTLGGGYKKIELTNHSCVKNAKLAFAGMTDLAYKFTRKNLQLAIMDIGKTGSDGAHNSSDRANPKFGAASSHLCSEFVSWYNYAAGITIKGASNKVYNFKDITSTMEAYRQFRDAGKLYYYHCGRRKWVKDGTSSTYYTPKPGDWLILKPNAEGKGEHSMILLSYDSSTGIAHVINGPWPITVRKVTIHRNETKNGRDYCIGTY